MNLNHLHLHVRNLTKSRRFYETYFGFREHARHGRILFLRNRRGFSLALAPAAKVERFPAWFHYGFRLPSASAVRRLHGRLGRAAGPLGDEAGYVWFRCTDPDGYAIEVYWE